MSVEATVRTIDDNVVIAERLTLAQLTLINMGIKGPSTLGNCLRRDMPRYSGDPTSHKIEDAYKCYGPGGCEVMLKRNGLAYCGYLALE
jgi:hypothetical protein